MLLNLKKTILKMTLDASKFEMNLKLKCRILGVL